MLTIDEARSRVAKGAAHLDQTRPNWFNEIDPGTLTLSNPCGCIVGQLMAETTYGNFGRQARCLFPIDVADAASWGIDITARDTDGAAPAIRTFALLQDAWIEAIADRRLRCSGGDAGSTEIADARSSGMDHPSGGDRVKELV